MIKLNLGCGLDYKEGYINVDNRKTIKADIYADCGSDIGIEAWTVDHIVAYDILEHFPYRDRFNVFNYWISLLKTGGTIEIMVPNLSKIAHDYIDNLVSSQRTIELLFGGQTYQENFHYCCYDGSLIKELFHNADIQLVELITLNNNLVAKGKK